MFRYKWYRQQARMKGIYADYTVQDLEDDIILLILHNPTHIRCDILDYYTTTNTTKY